MSEVTIFTDGACRGNPGVGGWGVVLTSGEHRKEINGVDPDTTNNRMELLAAIRALEALKRRSRVHLYTDSTYVKKGITEWLAQWQRNNWKTAARKPVKNAELWRRLAELVQQHKVSWHWVKGHAGHPGNERADALANKAIDEWLSACETGAVGSTK
jgi:ribonuclease HI